ncbi:MAG: succinyldiaminopimelate transaminase [Gammaproteobacteria bacterium]|nr:succinyldiaminopimelate transaminase [Gammaproteobacteria bacterium]
MRFNPQLELLQQYPFERLRDLTRDVSPNHKLEAVALSIGEPKHAPPTFVIRALSDPESLRRLLATYPATKGSQDLRAAITNWLRERFRVTVDANTEVLPVNGTREALFSFAQAMLDSSSSAQVLMPNPFYQIYEGAAILAGAEPIYLANDPQQGYQQDYSRINPATWKRIKLVYVCSPGNPTGQVMTQTQMCELIELAHRYDFIIASDECYSEIYFDDTAPPCSLLSASEALGNANFSRCVVFHSLSKRSNLPGLRSGFVAGDAQVLSQYLLYRTYHGCALGAHHQLASTLAWNDQAHVDENRALYQVKFAAISDILSPTFPIRQPQGGFYHWLETPISDTEFCKQLLAQQNITVMPGTFLGRDSGLGNPGTNHVRVAWVANLERCVEAAHRLVQFGKSLA